LIGLIFVIMKNFKFQINFVKNLMINLI
jgi:hypothetical protein